MPLAHTTALQHCQSQETRTKCLWRRRFQQPAMFDIAATATPARATASAVTNKQPRSQSASNTSHQSCSAAAPVAKATPSRNWGGTRWLLSKAAMGTVTQRSRFCTQCTVHRAISLEKSLAVPALRLASETRRHHPRPIRSVDMTASGRSCGV